MRLKRTHTDESLFLLWLADWHSFHACGVTPPGFENSAGNKLNLNTGQRYLWECNQHLQTQLPQMLDGLFLVGDMIEGQNPAEGARELSDTDETFQVRGTVETLEPFVKKTRRGKDGRRNLWMVKGSRYHSGEAGNEALLGQAISARKQGRHYAPPWRFVQVGRVLFDIAHHQSFTIRNASMPLEREVGFYLERVGRARQPVPEVLVIVRAHVHKGFRFWQEDDSIFCLGLPCMKLQDTFAASSRTPNRLMPSKIGAVGVRVFSEPVDGVLLRPVPLLYEHPKDEVEVATFG